MHERLIATTAKLGKRTWKPLLGYVAELHARSVLAATPPFPHPWEEIGPGYCGSPCFGHWDIVHQMLDQLPAEPEHVRNQIINNLAMQQRSGLVPGTIWVRGGKPKFSKTLGHPPVWPVAVDDYVAITRDRRLLATCYQALRKQIGWFERHRQAEGGGFFYDDVRTRKWESGIDDGIRFEGLPKTVGALVDATAHVYDLHQHAAAWASRLGEDGGDHLVQMDHLRQRMRTRMFDPATGLFQDEWRLRRKKCILAFEGMWPMVVGAADASQAHQVIDENLLNPKRFFSQHPITSVGMPDPRFELRLWRGPTWNSMTYWAARGCLRYGRADAAHRLLEAALDATAKQYAITGTIWEFYHPFGKHPADCVRKPYSVFKVPCLNYLGHNPLIAMARLWEQTAKS